MRNRLIPDPATARWEYERQAIWARVLSDDRAPVSTIDDAAEIAETAALALDNATALWISGDRPRGTETKAVPLS